MKIRTAHVVAMTVVLLALAIAACGGVAGPAAGQGPGSINAATVKACDDILAFEHGDADGTFNQEPASVKALHDARHTPLENDLAAWIKAMNAGSGYSDPAMQQADTTASRVGAEVTAPGGVSSVAVTSARNAWAAGGPFDDTHEAGRLPRAA